MIRKVRESVAADWKESLDEETRAKAVRLIGLMEQAGAPDAEMWIRSEIQENFPQFARYLLLENIGVETIGRSREFMTWLEREMTKAETRSDLASNDAAAALNRLLDLRASIDDLSKIARYAIEAALFRTLVVIDNGWDDKHESLVDQAPGWVMAEIDTEGNPTGRLTGGLHESFDTAQQAGS